MNPYFWKYIFIVVRYFIFSHQEVEIKIARSCEKNTSGAEEDKSELQAKLYT